MHKNYSKSSWLGAAIKGSSVSGSVVNANRGEIMISNLVYIIYYINIMSNFLVCAQDLFENVGFAP